MRAGLAPSRPARYSGLSAQRPPCVDRPASDGTTTIRRFLQDSILDAALRTLFASPVRNLTFGVLYMLAVMAAAVGAYVAMGWSLGDAVYMVVITVYTVGYGETMPVDSPGLRAVTMATIVPGCTGMIFLTDALVQFITLNQLNELFGVKRMGTKVASLRNHAIVCGFGRTGSMLAHELQAGGMAFVVLEQSEAAAEQAREQGHPCLRADATDEKVLRAAGIAHARALAAVLSNDAANVFITLIARSLNRKLQIIARGEVPATESKLLLAGADQVVMPTHIGAERIAEMILFQQRPGIDFGSARSQDVEMTLERLGVEIEVFVAEPGSPALGLTVEQLEQRAPFDFLIVQINRHGGESISRPDGSARIEPMDGVVLLGRGPRMRAAASVFEGGTAER